MSDSPIFDWVCQELDSRTALSGTEARGTIRLVLKDAGLQPKSVNQKQMTVVVSRLLPATLKRLKVESSTQLCDELGEALQRADLTSPMLSTPEDVFTRLGRR